jgi:Flp pilus assembly protein TadB
MSGKKAPRKPDATRKASKAQRSPAVAHGRAEHLVFFWIAAALVGLGIFGTWKYALIALAVTAIVWLVIRLARKRQTHRIGKASRVHRFSRGRSSWSAFASAAFAIARS